MARATTINASCGNEMAKIAGNSDVLAKGAAKVLKQADRLAAQHVKTGNYVSQFAIVRIPGKKGVTDRAVVNTDPAGHIIESGHWIELKDGGRKWVPGQFILTTAAILASSAGRVADL